MERRQQQRRHSVLAALVLVVGVCACIDVALAQGAVPAETARPSEDRMEQWISSQPPEHQEEARELQRWLNDLMGEIREPPDHDFARMLRGYLDAFERSREELDRFIGRAKSQEAQNVAKLLKSNLVEPFISGLRDAITRATKAMQGGAGACLSLLAQAPNRKATTRQDQEKTADLEKKSFPNIISGVLTKEWKSVIDETDKALFAVKEIKEWTLPASRELYRGELLANRGLAYSHRREGDKADNIEVAIDALESAIKAYGQAPMQELKVCENQPALARLNLGAAYSQRIKKERADNLERAIAQYEQALGVLTLDDFSHEWALIKNNLGVVYLNRIREKRAENVDAAIRAFVDALQVWGKHESPAEWAMLQSNLGLAYSNRIHGSPTENIKRAIEAFEDSLAVRTRERPSGEKIRDESFLDKTIPFLRQVLEVLRNPHVLPPDGWARSQGGLGMAYLKRFGRDREDDDLEKAITAFEEALKLWIREAFPVGWAATKSKLGEAYASRVRDGRQESLNKAIAAYKEALTVRTREAFPRDNLETATLLGQALNAKGDWARALEAFDMARGSFRLLFGQGLNEAEARDLLEKAGPLFTEAAYAAAELGDASRALALLEEGKARLLAVALKLNTLNLKPDERGRLEDLRRAIREGERRYDDAQGGEKKARIDELAALRSKLAQLVETAEARGKAVTDRNILSRVTDLVPPGGALVAPIVAGPGGKLIIATRKGRAVHLSVVAVPKLTPARLDRTLGARDRGGWLGAFNEQKRRSGEWLAATRAAIEDVRYQLGVLLGRPLAEALDSQGIKAGSSIIILPSGPLGLLPLGLARDTLTRQYLIDDYTIAFAPSLAVLASAKARHPPARTQPTLAAVVNPTEDLPFTAVESALVESRFARGRQDVLREKAATPQAVLAALKDKDYWHFASHGSFDWDDPLDSGLQLADGKPLTVGKLIRAEGLRAPRLVVLSACETGLHEIATTPNEFIGLPAAFLQLGAHGVLATLWPVDDFSTALLVAKFYELHRGGNRPPAEALREAQLWLRGATTQDLGEYVLAAVRDGQLTDEHSKMLQEAIDKARRVATRAGAAFSPILTVSEAEPPFAHPYYWAGFTLTGL